jgi:hypothetical protein
MLSLIKTAVTSVEHQMLNQTSKTCFSRIGEMNKFYKKTEKCWKETTQKRLDSEKVQHNHFPSKHMSVTISPSL